MEWNFSDRQLKDAARLGVQAAVAAAAQYSIMRALEMPEQFVGIISAVLVVQPSIGNTLVAAQHRFVATVIGCVVGVASFLLLPDGYGTAVALAVAMLAMNVLAGLKPRWRYGVVAAIALALGSEGNIVQTSIDRILSIGLGVVVGTVVSLVVWPEKSSARAKRHLRDALDSICDGLQQSIDASTSDESVSELDAKRRFAREISKARDAASAVRIADDSQLREDIDNTERLYHATLILLRVSEEIDAQEEGGDELTQRLNDIGDRMCQAISKISDKRESLNGELEKIRSQLDGFRDQIEQFPSSATSVHALHFGLDEIEDSLTAFAK